MLNKPLTLKHALLCFFALFLIGAGTGGVLYCNNILCDTYVDVKGSAAPAVSAAGTSRIYHDSTSNTIKVSQNGGAFSNVQQFVGRNLLDNGSMVIQQRANLVNGATNSYSADRWKHVTAVNNSGQFSANTNALLANSSGVRSADMLRVTCGVINTSVSAGTELTIQQGIEGFRLTNTTSQVGVTLSFWVRSFQTGQFGVSLQEPGVSKAAMTTFTVNVSNTWEQKIITFTNLDNNIMATTAEALRVVFCLVGGSNFQGTANTAVGAGNNGLLTTSSQVNFESSTSNIFDITDIQLEEGAQATTFEYRPIQQELALCQRYCYVMAAASSGAGANWTFGCGGTSTTSTGVCVITYPVVMRTTPQSFSFAGTLSHVNFTTNVASSVLTVLTYNNAGSSNIASQMTFTGTATPWPGAGVCGWFQWGGTATSADMFIYSADF